MLLRVPNWVGDAAMATAVVQAFAAGLPEAEVEVLGRGAVTDLFPGLLLPERCHRLSPELRRELRGRFDLGVLLPDSFSSAWLFYRLGIPSLGRRGDGRSLLLRHRRPPRRRPPDRHLVEEWDELLEPLGLRPSRFLPRVVLGEAERAAGRRRLAAAAVAPPVAPAAGPERVAVLCPGATYGPAKRWPAERFAALARELGRTGVACVAAGSAAEAGAVGPVAAAAGTLPLLGLSVREWAACLAAAALVITNDSGAAHVAAACGTPALVLFGSTSPAWTRPLGPAHRCVSLGLACAPCFRRECPLGHLDCLMKLPVERVRDEALEMLGEGRAG